MVRYSQYEIEEAFLKYHWLHQNFHRFGKARVYPKGFQELNTWAVLQVGDGHGYRLADEPRGWFYLP